MTSITPRSALLAALLAIAGCAAPVPPPVPAPPPYPTGLVATGTAERVVLLSFDGLSADAIAQFGAPALQNMPLQVTRVFPVEPSVTSTTHASILTGATPDQTGVVSNIYHKAGTAPTKPTLGMETEIDAETLIDSAHKAGKRVGCLTFPGVTGTAGVRSPDWGLAYAKPVVAGRILHLTRTDFHSQWYPPAWGSSPSPRHPSFSPVMRARVEWSVPEKRRMDVDLVAYDSTDDRVANYDRFYAEYGGIEEPLDDKGWFAVSQRIGEELYGSWSKLLRSDPALASVTLYWGSISRTEGYPSAFRRMIEDEAGFWPGSPDEAAAKGWLAGKEGIDPATFTEQLERLSSFLTKATTVALSRMPFDLLIGYQPVVDQAEHQYNIVSDTQIYSSAENRAAGERVRRSAYAAFERALTAIRGGLDLSRDAIVVTGDHGMAAVDTEVRINQLLLDWGFATASGDKLTDETRWAAFATGNAVHLYRFRDPDDTADLAARLGALRAPDGAVVFERIDRKGAGAHANRGDLLAFSFPRFALSSVLGEPFVKPAYYGQHGGLASHPELQTVLGAAGRGVPTRVIPQARQTDVAPFVRQLLGLH
jgi:predicted AlkP superfamily pyrophosphatase or phosphodiesterase